MKSKSSKSTIRALGQRSISSTLLFCSHPPNQTSSGDAKEGANSAALASFEQITEFSKGKKHALFLDYDGTISPIVDNPEYSFMSDDMRSALKDVTKCFPTTIISGRSRDKVYEFIGLTELYYAGTHGMDIMSPAKHGVSDGHTNCIKSTDKQDKEGILFQPASGFLPMIEEATKDIKGETVENNKFCLSVHYRNVDEKDWKTIWDLVIDILKGYPHSL